MANVLNTRCQICGKMYNHCFKCKELAGWRAMADTHEHYQIAWILSEYREGVITVNEACNQFENIDITLKSDFSKFLPEVTRDIKTILNANTNNKPITNAKIDIKKK